MKFSSHKNTLLWCSLKSVVLKTAFMTTLQVEKGFEPFVNSKLLKFSIKILLHKSYHVHHNYELTNPPFCKILPK